MFSKSDNSDFIWMVKRYLYTTVRANLFDGDVYLYVVRHSALLPFSVINGLINEIDSSSEDTKGNKYIHGVKHIILSDEVEWDKSHITHNNRLSNHSIPTNCEYSTVSL